VDEFFVQEEYTKQRALGIPLVLWQDEELGPRKSKVRETYFKS